MTFSGIVLTREDTRKNRRSAPSTSALLFPLTTLLLLAGCRCSAYSYSPVSIGDGGSLLVAIPDEDNVIKFDLSEVLNGAVQQSGPMFSLGGGDDDDVVHPNHVFYSRPYLYISYGTDPSDSGIARINVMAVRTGADYDHYADADLAAIFQPRYIRHGLHNPKGFVISHLTGTMYVANRGTDQILMYNVGDGGHADEGSFLGVFDGDNNNKNDKIGDGEASSCRRPNHMALFYNGADGSETLFVTMGRHTTTEGRRRPSTVVAYNLETLDRSVYINAETDLRTLDAIRAASTSQVEEGESEKRFSDLMDDDDDDDCDDDSCVDIGSVVDLEGIKIACLVEPGVVAESSPGRGDGCTMFLTDAYGALHAVDMSSRTSLYEIDLTRYMGDIESRVVVRDKIKVTSGDIDVRGRYVYVGTYANASETATAVVQRYAVVDTAAAPTLDDQDDGDGAVFIRDVTRHFPGSVLLLTPQIFDDDEVAVAAPLDPSSAATPSLLNLRQTMGNSNRNSNNTFYHSILSRWSVVPVSVFLLLLFLESLFL